MPYTSDTAPFYAKGGPVGVVIGHGFAGSPRSVRPWGEHLARAGYTVSIPLLPGHGTCWADLETRNWQEWYGELKKAYEALLDECEDVFVFGFSLGGGLALRLAEDDPERVRGLVLINPSIGTRDKRLRLLSHLPYLSRVIRTSRGIGSDIMKPNPPQTSYERVPVRAAYQVTQMWKSVCADLTKARSPILVFKSRTDHVVDSRSIEILRQRVPGGLLEERIVENSYHVVPLDNDALTVFEASIDWLNHHYQVTPGYLAAGSCDVRH